MPLVQIRYSPDHVTERILQNLSQELPRLAQIVAEELTEEGAELETVDVEIQLTPHGRFDYNTFTLQFRLEVKKTERRHRDIKLISKQIIARTELALQSVKHLLDKEPFYLWISLLDSDFTPF
jgi:hypothetical protein